MDYLGFNLSHNVLMGEKIWFEKFPLGKIEEFDPYAGGILKLLSLPEKLIDHSDLNEIYQPTLYVNHHFPLLLKNLDLHTTFQRTLQQAELFSRKPPKIVMHSNVGKGNLPLWGRFVKILTQDFQHCRNISAEYLIIHPPPGKVDSTEEFAELLTSAPVIQLMEKNPTITLCIENMTHWDFFGSLANLLRVRSEIGSILSNKNKKDLLDRVKFCFDTGHLLLWRYHHREGISTADLEIQENLAGFSQHTPVIHIKTCNSKKHYYVPFTGPNEVFLEHSKILMEWLKETARNRQADIFWCFELQRSSFTFEGMGEFGVRLSKVLKKREYV